MTKKLTLAEQEELFAKDCKLINLQYEYSGCMEAKKNGCVLSAIILLQVL